MNCCSTIISTWFPACLFVVFADISYYFVSNSAEAPVYQKVRCGLEYPIASPQWDSVQMPETSNLPSPHWWRYLRLGRYAFSWWVRPRVIDRYPKLASNSRQQKPRKKHNLACRLRRLWGWLKAIELLRAAQATSLSPNRVSTVNVIWGLKKSGISLGRHGVILIQWNYHGIPWLQWSHWQYHSSSDAPMISYQMQPTSSCGSSLTPVYAHHVKGNEALIITGSLHAPNHCRYTRGVIIRC